VIDFTALAIVLVLGALVVGGALLVARRETNHPEMYHLRSHPTIGKWALPLIVLGSMILLTASLLVPPPFGAENRSWPLALVAYGASAFVIWLHLRNFEYREARARDQRLPKTAPPTS
jgi:hypothetical protein